MLLRDRVYSEGKSAAVRVLHLSEQGFRVQLPPQIVEDASVAPGMEREWCAASYHGAPFIRHRTTSQRVFRSLVLGDLLVQVVRVEASGAYGDPRTGTFSGV